MIVVTVGFALLSALLNVVGAILQRHATGQVEPDHLYHHRILQAVITNRLWLGGITLQIAGFFAQAAALRNGSLVVVEPLLTTDIVFLIVILHFVVGYRLGWREWSAVVCISAGLGGLLAAANPHGGHTAVSLHHWLGAFAVIVGLIAIGATAMRMVRSSMLRAVLGGATAGLHFAFSAVATKLTLVELQAHGFWHLFATWQLYALILVGVSAALSMQSMYGSGSLTITQPAMEIMEAIAGISFGLLLFKDHISYTPGALVIEIIGVVVLFVGIVLLAGSRRFESQATI